MSVLLARAALILLLLPTSAVAQDATPAIAGVWKLNPEKSKMRVASDYTEIRQYTMRADGYLVGLLIQGTPQGYHYLQFVARSDGSDYPEYSDQIVGDLVATGRPTRRTYAEKPIDAYVTDWIDKVDGRIIAQGKKIVSKDRSTLTITVDGSPNLRIYDRQ